MLAPAEPPSPVPSPRPCVGRCMREGGEETASVGDGRKAALSPPPRWNPNLRSGLCPGMDGPRGCDRCTMPATPPGAPLCAGYGSQEHLSRQEPIWESEKGMGRGLGATEGAVVVGCLARVDLYVVPSTVSCCKEKFL
jgi:hypothetical protein